MAVLLTRSGRPLAEGIASLLKRIFSSVMQQAGKAISESLVATTQKHFLKRFPNSIHWAVSKVKLGKSSTTSAESSGEVDIGVAGASRAYGDIWIRPVNKKMLAIPIHKSAMHKKPADFSKLSCFSNGLWQQRGGSMVKLFLLARQAHQKQDKSLLPSDDAYAMDASSRISQLIKSCVGQDANNV